MEEGRESTAVNRSHTQITAWGGLELAGKTPATLSVAVGWVFRCRRDAVSEMAADRGKGSGRASIAVSRSRRWLLHPYIHRINALGGLPPKSEHGWSS